MGLLDSILGGVGSLAGGIAGLISSNNANDRANALQNEALQQYLNIAIPDPAEQKIALQQYVQTGQLSPKLQQAIKQAPSNLNDVSLNSDMTGARLRALNSLEQQGYGGNQIQNEAALQQDLIQAGNQGAGQQQQILQSLAQRGQLGSGSELQARLSNAQNSQNQLANQALQTEMQRRQQALQAIQGAGSLAGNIQQSQYQLDANRAQANDAINQFNAQNLQGVQAANVGAQNAAQLYNLQNAQNIANQNTNLANQQEIYNKQLLQQNFQNQLAKAGGVAGQYNTNAGTQLAQGQQAANQWGAIGSGLGKLGGAAGSGGGQSLQQSNANILGGGPMDSEENPLNFLNAAGGGDTLLT